MCGGSHFTRWSRLYGEGVTTRRSVSAANKVMSYRAHLQATATPTARCHDLLLGSGRDTDPAMYRSSDLRGDVDKPPC